MHVFVSRYTLHDHIEVMHGYVASGKELQFGSHNTSPYIYLLARTDHLIGIIHGSSYTHTDKSQ